MPRGMVIKAATVQLINHNSGSDMRYQYNKVHNLKLAAATIDGLLIRPGETFSFWQRVRHAERGGKYLDGLVLAGDKIIPAPGGGLCQLSNLLFWLFLHSPLIITERHPHSREAFPAPVGDVPSGVDATVGEGYQDLKVLNSTDSTYQLIFDFGEETLTASLLSDRPTQAVYAVSLGNVIYHRQGETLIRESDICRQTFDRQTNASLGEACLYHGCCALGYAPADYQDRSDNK